MTLALVLPLATIVVERVCFGMNVVKSRLRNCIRDQWMNDILVVYIKKYIFNEIDNETIIKNFQDMETRRGQL